MCAAAVLETASATGAYGLAMIAITPAGWDDWASKSIDPDTRPMKDLQPLLARARAAGIGLVGMKAGRHIAGRKFLGWGKSDVFDEHYGDDLLKAGPWGNPLADRGVPLQCDFNGLFKGWK